MKRTTFIAIVFIYISSVIFIFNYSIHSQSCWVKQTTNVSDSLKSVCFTDSVRGWVCGSNGTVLKTTNGGNNWTVVYTQPGKRFNYVKFFNSSTGIVCGGGIIKTTNAGADWFNVLASSSVFTYTFANENTGWYSVPNNIYKTTDGGNNWNICYSNPSPSNPFEQVKFTDASTGFYSCGYLTYAYPNYYNHNYVYKSTNGGINWTQCFYFTIGTNTRDTLETMIGFPNANTGFWYCVGKASPVILYYQTTNGGTNWTSVGGSAMQGVNAMAAPSSYEIWLSKGNPTLYSTNSGAVFSSVFLPANNSTSLKDIFFLNSLTGWITGTNGAVYRTVTGSSPVPLAPSLNNPQNNDTTVCIPADFSWFASTTAVSYRIQVSTNSTFSNILFDTVTVQTGISAPLTRLSYGTAYYWRVNASNAVGTGGWSDIRYFKTTYLAKAPQLIYPAQSSTNMPLNVTFLWQDLSPLLVNYRIQVATSVQFTNPAIDSAGITQNQLTAPNGTLSGNTLYLWRVCSINANGQGPWSAARLFTTASTGIVILNSSVPDKFSLHQNYPNPYNNTTNLKFEIVKKGNVRITIYDVQGREIRKLVNEILPPGTYETKFEGTMLNSGVYFCKMMTDGFTETRIMLLIK